jgi:hypothetical protein
VVGAGGEGLFDVFSLLLTFVLPMNLGPGNARSIVGERPKIRGETPPHWINIMQASISDIFAEFSQFLCKEGKTEKGKNGKKQNYK